MTCPIPDKNITILQGSYWSMQIIVDDADGNRVNLTGRTFAGQIRSSYDASTVTASFSFDTTNAATGEVLVYLSATTTAAIPVNESGGGVSRNPTNYIYDIEMTNGSVVRRISQGIASVIPEVTKP